MRIAIYKTSAMLSILGRAGAILLAVVDASHVPYVRYHVLKAVQKHNTKRLRISYAHRGPVSNAEISIRSAVQQTLTTLKGCRAMIVG